MMKKVLLTFLVAVTLVSCSLDDDNDTNMVLKTLPIKAYEVPEEFEFGMSYTLKVEYDLPNSCHRFYNLYYQYKDTARVVAITSIVNTTAVCNDTITPKEYDFVVSVKQRQDYIFKFWKGEDEDGEAIFEDVVVPVINN